MTFDQGHKPKRWVVQNMVCPHCVRRGGSYHKDDCPMVYEGDDLDTYMRAYDAGASQKHEVIAYYRQKLDTLISELEGSDGVEVKLLRELLRANDLL